MSRSLVASIALAIAAAAGAFASVAVASRDYVVSAAHRACDFVLYCMDMRPGAQAESPGLYKPRVALVAGKAFVLRLVKRERPRVTPLWRMCPSI